MHLSITIDPILCRMYEIDLTSSLLFETIALMSFRTQISSKVLQPGDGARVLSRRHIKVPILKEVNFGKMQLCRVEHLLNTISTYLSSKLDSTPCNQNIGEGESDIDEKNVKVQLIRVSFKKEMLLIR